MTLIDPLAPRPFGSQEPPMLKSSLSTFVASHVLAFGTDYGLFSYLRELEGRLAAGERFKFATSDDFYNALIPDLIERGRSWEAVKHYLDSRGLARRLRDAAQILQEASLRGELVVQARKSADEDLTALSTHDWRERGWLSPFQGVLYRKREIPMATIEWFDLTFDRREVEALRSASWHTLGENVLAFPPTASQAPAPLAKFIYLPNVLARAVGEWDRPGEPTRRGLSMIVARLFAEAGGKQTAGKPAESIEALWKRSGTDGPELVRLSAQQQEQ